MRSNFIVPVKPFRSMAFTSRGLKLTKRAVLSRLTSFVSMLDDHLQSAHRTNMSTMDAMFPWFIVSPDSWMHSSIWQMSLIRFFFFKWLFSTVLTSFQTGSFRVFQELFWMAPRLFYQQKTQFPGMGKKQIYSADKYFCSPPSSRPRTLFVFNTHRLPTC